MYIYTLIDADEKNDPVSFLSDEDAIAYAKAFPFNWNKIKSKQILHLNAQSYVEWDKIPDHLNFVFQDSTGIYACQYKPHSKWYGSNNDVYRIYGGERLKLEYSNWHNLMKLGDIYERQGKNTFHFINWNKINKSYAVKFIDDTDQTLEVFNDQGELIFSGSNDDVKFVFKKGSFQFEKFPWQTYTFIKE